MISREVCRRVLQKAVSTGADYAELFAENTVNHSIRMIADKVDAIQDAVVAGAAVRVYKGLRSVMASTVDTSESGPPPLRRARPPRPWARVKAAIDIVLHEHLFGDIHPVKIAPTSVSNAEKIDVVKASYAAAKEFDPSIAQVTSQLLDVDHNILIANTEGTYAQDRQIRTRLFTQAVAEKNGETQVGFHAPGRRMGMEMFDFIDPKAVGIHGRQAGRHHGGGRLLPRRRDDRGH